MGLAACLDHVARMPRAPFLQPTLRVTSTRRNTTSGDRLPGAVGKPAVLGFTNHLRARGISAAPRGDAGPPCGHPASSGRALDGALPASGHSTLTLHAWWHGVRGELRCFFGWRKPRRTEPSGISSRRPEGSPPKRPVPDAWARGHRGTSMRPVSREPEMPSTGGDLASALSRLDVERRFSLAGEGGCRTGSSMFEDTD